MASGFFFSAGWWAAQAQQALIEAVRQLLEEFRQLEPEHLGHTTLRDAEVLKVLVLVLRLAHIHTYGRPRSRGFLDFVHQQFRRDAIGNRYGERTRQPDHHAVKACRCSKRMSPP